jgi:hypothetical protein
MNRHCILLIEVNIPYLHTVWLVDQLGIVGSILGGGFGSGYFGLACYPEHQRTFVYTYAGEDSVHIRR